MSEAQLAKEYWSTTRTQNKEYADPPPLYVRSLGRVINKLSPECVLEIGCNTGRNLLYLSSVLNSTCELRGIDVNQESIDFGKNKWNLNIETADETFLASQDSDSFDLIFTISVLDHIPDINQILNDIKRVTSRYLLIIEPYPEKELTYLRSFQEQAWIETDIETATPYSYTHDYARLVPAAGFDLVLDLPMLPYKGHFGPLYRLSLFRKYSGFFGKNFLNKPSDIDWQSLHDEIVFESLFGRPPDKTSR